MGGERWGALERSLHGCALVQYLSRDKNEMILYAD
jgi:hypothetical protein